MRKSKPFRLDLLSGDLAAALVLGLAFSGGAAAGEIAGAGIEGAAGTALRDYLQAYLSLAQSETVNVPLLPVLWEQVQVPLLVVLFGFTTIGVFGIPVLFVARGFIFSFSVSCFCRVFGWRGLVPALFLFGLPALLWAPALFVLGTQAMCGAYARTYCREGTGNDPIPRKGREWIRSGLCAAALLSSALFESIMIPALVGVSVRFLL